MAVCHGNAHFGFQGDGGIECASIIATHSGVRHGDTCVDLGRSGHVGFSE